MQIFRGCLTEYRTKIIDEVGLIEVSRIECQLNPVNALVGRKRPGNLL